MSDYIDRENTSAWLYNMGYLYAAKVIQDTKRFPSAQPEPQRIGRWIPCTKNGLPLSEMAYREGHKWYGYKCSNCNFIYKGNALTESPYCKKCGARMEGE